jgi:hypothetical protein
MGSPDLVAIDISLTIFILCNSVAYWILSFKYLYISMQIKKNYLGQEINE